MKEAAAILLKRFLKYEVACIESRNNLFAQEYSKVILGSSMSIHQIRFIEILNNEGVSQKIELVNQKAILGRHSSCTIQVGLEDLRVSNRHAVIQVNGPLVFIEDLGSTNHVFVNGEQITKAELKHNDIIRFGSQGPRLRFIIEGHENSDEIPPHHSNQLFTEPNSQNPNVLEDNFLFDVSPGTESVDLHQLGLGKQIIKPKTNDADSSNSLAYIKQQNLKIDEQLFDVSPSAESIELDAPFHASNTLEISSRLQKQIMNTQDIDILVKNPKTREKILKNKNIGEQQKRFINSVTAAYISMKRRYFLIFGLIIILLCAGIAWFANGYFTYKHQFSKARSLKHQIASFDELLEKARTQDGITDSSKTVILYKKLQQVQAQFDSIKAKLELKDQRKIYSDTVEVFLDEIMVELNEKNYSIPQHMLERVKYYINQFTTQKRRSTEILRRRRGIYFPEIERIFLQKNVPPILGYVAMQESMFDTNALSSAGALGMWQFMESTGRRFNLKINNTIDERLNWKKSTVAAASYFRSLLLLFGDGRGALLAIAAYNAGEEKIRRALANVEDPIRDRDFWYLYRTSSILAMETREYVPQVLARIIIDRHPELYGF